MGHGEEAKNQRIRPFSTIGNEIQSQRSHLFCLCELAIAVPRSGPVQSHFGESPQDGRVIAEIRSDRQAPEQGRLVESPLAVEDLEEASLPIGESEHPVHVGQGCGCHFPEIRPVAALPEKRHEMPPDAVLGDLGDSIR